MPYSAGGAAGAGVMAGVVTLLALYATLFAGQRNLQLNVLFYLGLAVAPAGRPWLVYPAGFLIFIALSAAAALVHAGLHQAFSVETDIFAWGVLFGAGQWVVLGAALGLLARRHPAVASGAVSDPGPFATHYSLQTAVVFLAMHLLFGAFVAAFYDALR